jgi:rod shape determining protein RodA
MLTTLKKLDWLMLGAAFLLVAVGILALYGLSLNQQKDYFSRQIIWIGAAAAVVFFFSFFDYRLLRNYSSVILFVYGAAALGLAAVLFLGVQVRGAASWINIGFLNIQPVEIAKFALLALLAKYFSGRHIEIWRVRHIVISGGYAGFLVFLVLMQPDLGSASILFFMWLGVTIAAGIKIRHLLILTAIFLAVLVVAWQFFLAPYQKHRIVTFLAPESDRLGAGYNILQSKIAIGSGGLWGKGLGRGSQARLNFLPEAHSDFIFAAIAEEWGFMGASFLLGLYLVIFWRLFRLAADAPNNFSRFFIIGFSILLIIQVFINVGMNLGILPITGISLPFVSYGGSNLILMALCLGIIQGIKLHSVRL